MLDPDPPFRPLRRHDGYLPLEDLGLVGDGTTAALVGLDGSIPWLCLPRFDSEPLFCGLLDHARGGHFTVAPDDAVQARQRYEPDTAVLTTELASAGGRVRITDALALRSGADLTDDTPAQRAELVRSAVVTDGDVRLRVELRPRGGVQMRSLFSGLELRVAGRPDLRLHLRSNRPLPALESTYDLHQGERLDLVLSWGRFHRHHRFDAETMLTDTADAWRRWMAHFRYSGPEESLVRRAAITLKLLRQLILNESWDEDAQTLCEHLDGGGSLDASLLALPLRQIVPADHPRMVATTDAIAKRLSAGNGLLHRYLHDQSTDGLPGDEGAFVLCSFWLVDNLARQGRVEEAEQLYASLCARASPLGLLSEQIDPSTGEFIGNFPQAFSHIGIIVSGVNLARAEAGIQ
ncbi:glycoside hydrolase family 15 protein [Saccharopolyspora sp. 5N708]|uniref:glycoside hydrolase family 15 protein n=1 Tax=Saccharopolyspora sp. 5N708 TaxID=3457424 RepID=UPI003FD6081A